MAMYLVTWWVITLNGNVYILLVGQKLGIWGDKSSRGAEVEISK